MPTSDGTIDFSYAATFQSRPQRIAARAIERVSGQRRLKRLYDHYRANPRSGEPFWEAAIRLMELDVRHDAERLAGIPVTGPLVIVANHPFGVLDGLVLCALVGRVRRDFKLLVHAALYQAPEAMPDLLPLDFSGGPAAARTILQSRAVAMSHLKNGGCLLVFPAGAVATTPNILAKRALDGEWGPFTAKLIRRSGATVVPFHFSGQNSRLFQMASHISYTVRLSLMFRETARRIGSAVHVRIGDPIPAAALKGFSDERLMGMLRERTDSLGDREKASRQRLPKLPVAGEPFPSLPMAALAPVRGFRNRRAARQTKVLQHTR
jgi:putative hemolysin